MVNPIPFLSSHSEDASTNPTNQSGKNAPPDDHIMSAIALKEPAKILRKSASAKVVLPKT